MTNTRRPPPSPADLAQLIAPGAAAAGAPNIGQYVTAAMLAAAQDPCDCECCQLLRTAGKAMRQSLLT
jgi:hypothetical protein